MALANVYDCFKMIYSFEECLQSLKHFHNLNYFLGLILFHFMSSLSKMGELLK